MNPQNPQQKIAIEINTVEASFIFRSLLHYKNRITEILEHKEIAPHLETAFKTQVEVASYQDLITSDLMLLMSETFVTDVKYLLPQ